MDSRTTVLVDIDNTIAQTQKAYIQYANTRSAKPFIYEKIIREYSDDMSDPFEAIVRGFINSKDYENTVEAIEAYEGIRDAFIALHDANLRLCVASSRIDAWHRSTAQWLHSQGLLPYIDCLFLRTEDISSADFKQAMATAVHPRYVFDDSAITSELLTAVDTYYLIDQPWNRDVLLRDHVKRTKNFVTGARELLLEITQGVGKR